VRNAAKRNEYAIASYLTREGISIGHPTVYNILKMNGLIKQLFKELKKRTYIRFSRRCPNSLWRADLTIFRRGTLQHSWTTAPGSSPG